MHTSRLISVSLLIILVMTGRSAGTAASSGPRPSQSTQPGGSAPLVIPARRAPDAPPALPAALPPAALTVTPLTIEVRVRRQSGTRVETVRQTVSRTTERIHVAASDGREWLFDRNPRDSRRAFGTLIDHAARTLVLYDESDLRNILGIRGWAQVLSLGLDHELLEGLHATTKTRSIGDIGFIEHAADREDGLREVWWSEAAFLPGQFTTVQGKASLRFSVERIREGVDGDLLRPAAKRFPAYRVVDLAEWLEGH